MNKAFGYEPWQEPGFLEDHGGQLYFDGANVVELASSLGTPLYVYSERCILEAASRIQEGFEKHHDRVCFAFASKACSLDAILGVVKKAGLGLEVNSKGELTKARRAGFDDSVIVFNGVSKSCDELLAAMSPSIKAINVDSPFELQRIIQIATEKGKSANVGLRLVPELESGTSPGNETASSATKFGMTEDDLAACLPMIRQAGESVHLAGIHVHVGSQITDLRSYAVAGKFVAEKTAEVERFFGQRLDHINVGGGFPSNYVKYNDQSPDISYYQSEVTPEDIAAAVIPPIRDNLNGHREIVIEPGRSMMSSSAILLSRVENIKRRQNDDWLFLDAGYHTLIESFSYRWYYHMLTASRTADKEIGLFRVVGPLCDNGDSFYDVEGETTIKRMIEQRPELRQYEDFFHCHLVHLPSYRELPKNTTAGDLIAFLDVGAYSQDQLFAMNGRGRPAVVMISENGHARIIRHADREEDMSLNEVD